MTDTNFPSTLPTMKALIVADSPEFEQDTLLRECPHADIVIALDGAAEKLPKGVTPAIICGDFDSINLSEAKKRFPQAEFLFLENQYANDLEKALLLIKERGATEVLLCCALGGRIDQCMANISVMARYHGELAIVALHGGMSHRVASRRAPVRVVLAPGDVVSTIPLGGPAIVTITGVLYPLAGQELRTGSLGVGNEAIGGEVLLDVEQGEVLFCCEHRSDS